MIAETCIPVIIFYCEQLHVISPAARKLDLPPVIKSIFYHKQLVGPFCVCVYIHMGYLRMGETPKA